MTNTMKLFAIVASFLVLTCSAAGSATVYNDKGGINLGIVNSVCSILKPTAVYNGSISNNTGAIKLRIATGAASQSRLIKGTF